MSDFLRRFLFEEPDGTASIRGEFIELHELWQTVQQHHHEATPKLVTQLLGQMLAASGLLCANLKFDGSLIMQIQGDGPLKLMVAECTTQKGMRATYKLANKLDASTFLNTQHDLVQLINQTGQGRFVITLLMKSSSTDQQQTYQGIVPIEGESLSQMLESYMHRSQQLETRLWLVADQQVARGLLLQKLPSANDATESEAEETWQRVLHLANTLKTDELLNNSVDLLRHRLFHQETVRVFEPELLQFSCHCSRDKVSRLLQQMGSQAVQEGLLETNPMLVQCEFCGKQYVFNDTDCAGLFLVDDGLPS